MPGASTIRRAAEQITAGGDVREAVGGALAQVANDRLPAGLDPGDFATARQAGFSTGTRIVQQTCSLDNASETLNQSSYQPGPQGPVHVITPMVMPKGRRFVGMLPVLVLAVLGLVGAVMLLPADGLSMALFGPHYWIILVLLAAFLWWRLGMVMVPEGCQALISRFGKVENLVGPGLVTLFNPWKRVSYIVNTTREYPFNAPIHQAPTKSGVQASVDLFLQFRIVDPRNFIFALGAVQGFQDKLNNAISETTRSLIYEQEAAGIYDLVGESTQRLLEQLNHQFSPAVEFTHANITHAEPSSQEYRMDLAAPEMVRVAKEAYTYEYELQLRKEQNEGDLNKDLASLNETLSSIQADIAKYQAQMDTALERETNRAKAMARQRFVEAESEANANAALLEAQALDIRAMSAAEAPEILDYRFQQDLLARLEQVRGSLPQIVQIGGRDESVDYLKIAQGLVGGTSGQLFSADELEQIRERKDEISARVSAREASIESLLEPPAPVELDEIVPAPADEALPGADRLEEIRRSVESNAESPATSPGFDSDSASAPSGSTSGSDTAGRVGERPTPPVEPGEPDTAGRVGEPDTAGRVGEPPRASRIETTDAPGETHPVAVPGLDTSAGGATPQTRSERHRLPQATDTQENDR
ncbi:SPFH domain-containing protein [Luteipulveratus flavus]|uniref:SPFH domain-containing protein n=1 Tax=Luteipulveratus flavus TaxID=3031728 RepID=A0ABT6CBB5_9MICO|nr:SPFH domain-containing protein [Luteipulveratus sp. YIM 133296]MDF8265617.1 SPFH domain-containing protein [Luteipulveratus sp. YIM 133296]